MFVVLHQAHYRSLVDRIIFLKPILKFSEKFDKTPSKIVELLCSRKQRYLAEKMFDRILELPTTSVLRKIFEAELYQISAGFKRNISTKDMSKFSTKKTPFAGSDTLIRDMFEAFLQDVDATRELMHMIDSISQESTANNLEQIDQAKKAGTIIRKDLVLVGGGPLTSALAALLSPFYKITVISDQQRVGMPWRARHIISLNSRVSVQDPAGPALPLVSGTTTPIAPSISESQPRLWALINTATRIITCPDGTQKDYLAGNKVGEGVATVIGTNADDYLLGQQALPNTFETLQDGAVQFNIQDIESGKKRTLQANACVFLGGPGKETCGIENEDTQTSYESATQEVDKMIQEIKLLAKEGRFEAIRFQLPRILTLTSIEKLYDVWVHYCEKRDELFPFTELFTNKKRIAIVGLGDTGKVILEFLRRQSPSYAYPKEDEFFQDNLPKVTLFGASKDSLDEFVQDVRVRYRNAFQKVFEKITNLTQAKAVSVKTTKSGVIITSTTPNNFGKSGKKLFDYCFIATGLEKTDPNIEFSQLSLRQFADLQNNVVGLRGTNSSFYITGTADRLPSSTFPKQLQLIINKLGISENTVALWVHVCRTLRTGFTILRLEDLNTQQMDYLLSRSQLDDWEKYLGKNETYRS